MTKLDMINLDITRASDLELEELIYDGYVCIEEDKEDGNGDDNEDLRDQVADAEKELDRRYHK